tara:strand:- start:2467 stop:2607 length:141 start_codon:yes stop_codon:yes gene_type:complete
MSAIKKVFKNSKIGKYIIAGSFFFFFIKGIIWIVIISLAWLGVGKL